MYCATWSRAASERARPRSMEERRTEERQQPPADEHCDPGAERNPGNDFRARRRVRAWPEILHLAESRGVEHHDVDPGEHHEGGLQAERVVVEILIRVPKKENGAGENVHHVAANSPWNEPVN